MPGQPGEPLARLGLLRDACARVFGTIKADRLLLEYVDERSGTFEPLRHVSEVSVSLSLITLKTTRTPLPTPFLTL